MAKAIAFLSILVLLSFAFVFLQLLGRRPAGASAAPAGAASQLLPMDDGSLYSVGLKLSRFEQRLMEEEQRSGKLLSELETLKKERDELSSQVEVLRGEIQRLRRQQAAPRNEAPPAEVPDAAEPGPVPAPAPQPAQPVPDGSN